MSTQIFNRYDYEQTLYLASNTFLVQEQDRRLDTLKMICPEICDILDIHKDDVSILVLDLVNLTNLMENESVSEKSILLHIIQDSKLIHVSEISLFEAAFKCKKYNTAKSLLNYTDSETIAIVLNNLFFNHSHKHIFDEFLHYMHENMFIFNLIFVFEQMFFLPDFNQYNLDCQIFQNIIYQMQINIRTFEYRKTNKTLNLHYSSSELSRLSLYSSLCSSGGISERLIRLLKRSTYFLIKTNLHITRKNLKHIY